MTFLGFKLLGLDSVCKCWFQLGLEAQSSREPKFKKIQFNLILGLLFFSYVQVSHMLLGGIICLN